MYGPILCIHIVSSYKDIPKNYYERSSLNTSIYSTSKKVIDDFVTYCQSGTICVNYGPALRLDSLPFGGFYDENEGKESLSSIIPLICKKQYVISKIEQ